MRNATLTSTAASTNARLAHSTIPNPSNTLQENASLPTTYHVTSTVNQQAPSWPPSSPPNNQASDMVLKNPFLDQSNAAAYPRPIVMNPTSHTDCVSSPSPRRSSQESSIPKPKIRAGLSESRKQEVKKMREIGSCIRCRILRKPCSETTPCVTCSAIDSPRNWKGFPCLHAKLVNLYQGYCERE
jgi:hypothetical protein